MSDLLELLKRPISMTFGKTEIVGKFYFLNYECYLRKFKKVNKYYIFIQKKLIYLDYDLLNDFRKDRIKRQVGIMKSSYTANPDPDIKEVIMYEDGDYFHIGCEKVEKKEFIKQFLNIKKQVENEQHNRKIREESATTSPSN